MAMFGIILQKCHDSRSYTRFRAARSITCLSARMEHCDRALA